MERTRCTRGASVCAVVGIPADPCPRLLVVRRLRTVPEDTTDCRKRRSLRKNPRKASERW
eukprot:scaffold282101_cov35-Tisochrysis_lutea.AAC.2